MKKTFLLVALVLAWSAAIPTPPVAAQDTFGIDAGGYNHLLNYAQIKHNTGGALDLLSVRDRYLKRQGKAGTGKTRSTGRGNTRRTSAPRVSTRFRSSLSARRNTFARIVARTRAVNPADADKLQRAYGTSNPIAPLAPTLKHYGLRSNDVADATALYLVVAWYGARGLDKDPPRAYVRAVRNQMARSYVKLPSFASTSNAGKQQLADSMWIQTMVVAGSINSAKGKPALMAQVKNAVRQGTFASFKIDMTKMKLDAKGLRA